jgi:hypothetical protein
MASVNAQPISRDDSPCRTIMLGGVMARIQLASGTYSLLHAQPYQICQVLPDERLLVENRADDGQRIVAHAGEVPLDRRRPRV